MGGPAVIPKATSPSHLRGNLDVVDWMLAPGDYDAISRLPYQACRRRDLGRADVMKLSEVEYATLAVRM